MSEIPEDVLATAGGLVNTTIRNYEGNVPANVARDVIARAILAERQRCAYVAELHLSDIAGCSMRDDEPERIARAILNQ